MGEVRWLHAEATKAEKAEAGVDALESHAVRRACGHWETLQAARPWAYLDQVAALIPCAACRRRGMQGPMQMGGDGL